MYHPTRGGVRGGRDQFSWDEVKVDKHRENYLGHSIKAPVGRWQKGKDLHWYTRDKKSGASDAEAIKEEIQRVKEEEEQAMRETLGLAPKRTNRPQSNRLDKHELSELVKRGTTAEDLGAGHAEAARVHGLGFSREPCALEEPSSLPDSTRAKSPEHVNISMPGASARSDKEDSGDENHRKKRRREEKKREKHDKREKRHSRDSDDRKKRKKDKERRRHDSD